MKPEYSQLGRIEFIHKGAKYRFEWSGLGNEKDTPRASCQLIEGTGVDGYNVVRNLLIKNYPESTLALIDRGTGHNFDLVTAIPAPPNIKAYGGEDVAQIRLRMIVEILNNDPEIQISLEQPKQLTSEGTVDFTNGNAIYRLEWTGLGEGNHKPTARITPIGGDAYDGGGINILEHILSRKFASEPHMVTIGNDGKNSVVFDVAMPRLDLAEAIKHENPAQEKLRAMVEGIFGDNDYRVISHKPSVDSPERKEADRIAANFTDAHIHRILKEGTPQNFRDLLADGLEIAIDPSKASAPIIDHVMRLGSQRGSGGQTGRGQG